MDEKEKKHIRIVIVTPYDNFLEGNAESIVLPTQEGVIGVMSGHAPLVVALVPGIISVREGDNTRYMVISDGYAEIGQHLCLVVTNSAEWPNEIDVERSYNNLLNLQEELNNANNTGYQKKVILGRIARSRARIELASKYGTGQQKAAIMRLSELQDNQ